MDLTLSEKLIHSVVPLAILDNSNRHIGSATGFILAFMQSEEFFVPAIVTNRHVFENAHAIGVTFTAAGADWIARHWPICECCNQRKSRNNAPN